MRRRLAPLPCKTETATETVINIHTLTHYDTDDSADEAAMMKLDEIRQEFQPRIPMLSAKTTTKIATWNVRTLYQTGKLAQVIKDFENYNLAILEVTEMQWAGSGKIKKKDKTILYCGSEELHQKGVGIILSKVAEKALIGWKPVNNRIITARFQSRHAKTTFVVIDAPIEEAEEEQKDNFYDQCQDVLNEIPKHDMILLLGEMNAQVDSNRQEHATGPHGSAQQTNDNGERLLMFCNSNG